ncbi:hypothetical protein [Bifidobacterium cuniculi]|uniref:K structural protein n=1 Tax=Bifidobacterium cuniculi TaxID=1688 RepID=A0A087AFH3_9BIFI|nr:hypothetical protein [Bifidobacterium cuniculi]KFI57523.1 K structural protein [Bifidobacterium cuniculi]
MVNMVKDRGTIRVEDDQSWRFGEQPAGFTSVVLDLTTFENATDELKKKYLTGVGETNTAYIRSGIPLARITSGDNAGKFGPYDPKATDGRNGRIDGLLESNVEVTVGFNGWDAEIETVGMRYRGDIIVANLPIEVGSDATWGGDFMAVDPETGVTSKLGAAAATKASD